MSSSAITGLSGTAPLNLPIVAVQAAAKSQATTASAATAANGTQPILMVPTKPPLSAAVMAELIGQQSSSPYGAVGSGYSSEQKPAGGLPAASVGGPILS